MAYQFHFYPTLLNEYSRYLRKPDENRFEKLLNRINRIPEKDPEILQKFGKGIGFENAVLKNKSTDISFDLIEETRSLLPSQFKSQQLVGFTKENIRFYGYVDVLGDSRVIDLKTTSRYRDGMHHNNFQNLYLYALRDYGFSTMEYIICDFEQIHSEVYHFDEIDFDQMLEQMLSFRDFLLKHQSLITDQKIIRKSAPNLFD
ncbi:hypothetical protein [Jiulongibacter sp. NS-SX5]|uniref:hypothetical protein n=1 Tax=Jiulongibacter sp. NS-SX5 TaxID=3463854 RepID=UPI0040581AB1